MRTRLYQALITSPGLLAMYTSVDGAIRIVQASSLTGVPQRPFMTYRMHTGFPLQGGLGQREYVQLWANDDPGDYTRIDESLRLARIAVEAIEPTEDFLEARWIETGVDLKDDVMGTINRYIRFQLTGTLRERE